MEPSEALKRAGEIAAVGWMGALIGGQIVLRGKGKSPGKIRQIGNGGIKPGKLSLIKGVARKDRPDQLSQLRKLMSGDVVAIGELARHQLCGDGFGTAGTAAAGGAVFARAGGGLKNVTKQPPAAAMTMPR